MKIARRGLIAALGAGMVLPAGLAKAQFASTPGEVLGPFYPLQPPADSDYDLTRVAGQAGRAMGPVIELRGRLVKGNGAPMAGATVELWQANAAGRYQHPADRSPVPLDPAFQGSATLRTDSDGRFRILSVLPGSYVIPDGRRRARHLHFQLTGPERRLVTQMYFPGETLNETDFLFATMAARGDNPADVVATAAPAGEPGVQGFEWTIRI